MTVPFPKAEGNITTCYSCLRQGRAAIGKDSAFGMISWQQAMEGVTHGAPELEAQGYELIDKGDDWYGVRLPKELMLELLRTPSYVTWQGDVWQFCCGAPMSFIGEWSKADFNNAAQDGAGRALFAQVMSEDALMVWDRNDLGEGSYCYVFRCPGCKALKAHMDMS
ncbi:CbrC family protein [Solimonas fluminis]|uniref:CbrC family protein n=1 Tax=Solimonas fluminis TaxID=2086571 RepID=UPI0013FD44A7|nr:CbrC family protein [Solimonas fluminis]